MSYAGDLPPGDAFERLATDPDAVLVDVRTAAEWQYVGVPDLSSIGKGVIGISWPLPGQGTAQDFVDQLTDLDPGAPLLFICRSGQRSRSAAVAATAAGFGEAYNVAEGFEGDLDPTGHRATVSGWKVAGLPWRQT
ncbi:MAG TPA: rhodanese-like domain-containing protein [Acidimicrobiia bacterium]|nr:rhodanese-like domain-containing protein [Acidimicrobiia bacterium]